MHGEQLYVLAPPPELLRTALGDGPWDQIWDQRTQLGYLCKSLLCIFGMFSSAMAVGLGVTLYQLAMCPINSACQQCSGCLWPCIVFVPVFFSNQG